MLLLRRPITMPHILPHRPRLPFHKHRAGYVAALVHPTTTSTTHLLRLIHHHFGSEKTKDSIALSLTLFRGGRGRGGGRGGHSSLQRCRGAVRLHHRQKGDRRRCRHATAVGPGRSGRGGSDRRQPRNQARGTGGGGGGGSGSRRFSSGRRGCRLRVLFRGAGAVVVVEVGFRVGGKDVVDLVVFKFAIGGWTRQRSSGTTDLWCVLLARERGCTREGQCPW